MTRLRSALLLLLAAVPTWAQTIIADPIPDGGSERWKVSRDQRIYVEGVLGKTIFENRSDELVTLDWDENGCLRTFNLYTLEQWVDGAFEHRPRPGGLCFPTFSPPLAVPPRHRVVLDLDTVLADPLPALMRVVLFVGADCDDDPIWIQCERHVAAPTRPFLVVEGDLERALIERAQRYGTIDVVVHFAAIPANPTPEESEEAAQLADELIADLTSFDVEILPGTSVGAVALRADPAALIFLLEDPRLDIVRPWEALPRIEKIRGESR